MSAHEASAERREQILGEVAEGLHLLFRETQRRAMEAEDNGEFVGLSETAVKLATFMDMAAKSSGTKQE